MKFYIFALAVLALAVSVFAIPLGQEVAKDCSPHLGYCQQTSDCCPGYLCLTYAAKCVVKGGLIIPEDD